MKIETAKAASISHGKKSQLASNSIFKTLLALDAALETRAHNPLDKLACNRYLAQVTNPAPKPDANSILKTLLALDAALDAGEHINLEELEYNHYPAQVANFALR